jgi:diguanylate cyclase (GGDEF)-like protein
MPHRNLDQAIAVAERLRRIVEELCIAHPSSPCGQVTISIGAAAMVPALGEHPERLVEAADAGLYSAKRRGRNTVVGHAPVTLAHAS